MPAADEPSSYEHGREAGEVAARLRAHDQHFTSINGSIADVARELHSLVLAVQRLGDAAAADRATVKATAAALRDADQTRRDNTERHWSPLTRFGIAAGALAAITTVVAAVLTILHH